MDRKEVSRVFEEMEHSPATDVKFEIVDVSDTYSSTDESPIVEVEDYTDPESVWTEISRFILALENKKKIIEETEVRCNGISSPQAIAKLSSFIDHLLYYITCEPKSEFLIGDTKNIILSFEGSILSVAGQALAQALVSGCAVVLLAYENFSSTAKLLRKIWVEAGLPGGRFQVRTDFPESLCTVQPSLKIFVGGQLIDGPEYHKLKPYFLHGHSTPMLVLDGADIESVVSVVLDKTHLLRHVEPWALTMIVIQESLLPKFKELILQRRNVSDINEPAALVQREHIELVRRYHLQNEPAEVHYLCQYRYLVFDAQPTLVSRPWYQDLNGQPLFVLPVRSAAEAVTKANHYGSGYAAAVFTEDGSLSQYVSEILQASTVWINTIGHLHPAAPLPFQVVSTNVLGHCQLNTEQSSGNFLNLLRFGTKMTLNVREGSPAELDPEAFSQEVKEKVKAAVAAQPAWEALGGLGRNKIFFKLYDATVRKIPEGARTRPTPRPNPVRVEVMEDGEEEGPSPRSVQLVNFVEEVGSPLSEHLRRSSFFLRRSTIAAESTYANQESGLTITTHSLPCGVIGIYVDNSTCSHVKKKLLNVSGKNKLFVKGSDDCGDDENVIKIIQGAITFGNTCVVILADDADYQLIDLIYGAASCLPKGVVNIIKSKDPSHWVSLVKHQEVKCLWHTDVLLGQEHKLLKHIEAKYSKRVWIGVIHYLTKIKEHTGGSLSPFEPHATIKKHVWRKSQAN